MSKVRVPDTIPQNDAEFDIFFRNLINYIKDKTVGPNPAWTHIPQAEIQKLDDAYDRWSTAYAQVKVPHTPEQTKNKNDVKEECTKLLRDFINAFIRYHPAVTADDKRKIGIHIPDDERTPIPAPPTRPIINSLRALGGCRIEIRFQDEATPGSRAVPYGDNGCILMYTIAGEKVTDYERLKDTALMTRTPFVHIIHDKSSEGSYFSCAALWQNETGERGEPSEIHSIVIVN
jgi:hypothetical protein